MQKRESLLILKRLFKYYLPYTPRILLGILAITLLTQCDIISTLIIKKIIEIFDMVGSQITQNQPLKFYFSIPFVFSKTFIGKHEIFLLMLILGLLAFINIFIKGIFVYGKEYTLNSANQKTLRAIRMDIFSNLLFTPLSFYERNQTGDIIAKVTNDVAVLEGTLMKFIQIITNVIQTVFFLGYMVYLNWKLTLISMVMAPVTGLILKKFAIPIRNASKKIVENISEITAFLAENISGIKIIKLFTREELEKQRFARLTKDTYSRTIKAIRLIAFQKPVNELLSTIGTLGIILFAGYQLLNHQITLAEFGQFTAVALMVYKPLKGLGEINVAFQRAVASGKRIFELMDQKKERGYFSGKILKEIKGKVEFKNVCFKYIKGKPVLKNINLTANPGEVIAIVGPSGSGKSTLVNLIPRFYEPQKGKILIDGINIKNINITSLRKHIGMVPQETILFSGTIKENIAYGKPDATLDEIITAAKNANAHNFIMRLKNKYDTHVGERGVKLSGGEKQRISIARAILKNPKILILDEATSSLDTESERLVQEALSFLMKGKTTFVIAHRLSTVVNADKIIVIENGRIVQTGTHKQLIKQKQGLYYKLCIQQRMLR